MNKDLRKRLEEAAERFAYKKWLNTQYKLRKIDCRIDFLAGAEQGYKEAIIEAKKWLIEHINCDVGCNKNGEPLAIPYVEGRKLAIKIADSFENEMNKLWENKL